MTFPWPYPDGGYFRRPAQWARPTDTDEHLAQVVLDRLSGDDRTQDQYILVDVQNRVAILTGWVDSAETAWAAGEQAWQTPGIADVCNQLRRRRDQYHADG